MVVKKLKQLILRASLPVFYGDMIVAGYIVKSAGRKKIAILFLTMTSMSFLDLIGIALIFPFLQIVMQSGASEKLYQTLQPFFSDAPTPTQLPIFIGFLLIGLYGVKTYIQTILLKIQARQLAGFTESMTNCVVEELLRARYAVFQNTAASELAGVAYGNTVHATVALTAMVQIGNEGFILFLAFLILLFYQPIVAIGAILLLSLAAIFLYEMVIKQSLKYGEQQRDIENIRYRLLFSIASAIRDIKIMGLEALFNTKNRHISHEYTNIAWRYSLNNAIPKILIEFMALVFIVCSALVVLVSNIPLGDAAPALGLMAVAAIRIVPAISRFFAGLSSFRSSRSFVMKLQQVRGRLASEAVVRSSEILSFNSKIRLEDVGFRYESKKILDKINIELGFGESIGIVGTSGAGKSTLLDLFTGLQRASSGRFYCDDVLYDPFTSSALHQLVGYVPQSIVLLDESIAFNIALEENPDLDKVGKALKLANIQSFIDSLPHGLNTNVGENGIRLSGGQRQRLGIARALYKSPKILIFDEATSSLDTVSESILTSEINKLHGDISSIVVAHRLSTVRDCDRIYVLSNGVVESCGTHLELLNNSPSYINLYTSQKR